ncbi:hypothetical protein HK101_006620, partial [Irineochytrium annulatum]
EEEEEEEEGAGRCRVGDPRDYPEEEEDEYPEEEDEEFESGSREGLSYEKSRSTESVAETSQTVRKYPFTSSFLSNIRGYQKSAPSLAVQNEVLKESLVKFERFTAELRAIVNDGHNRQATDGAGVAWPGATPPDGFDGDRLLASLRAMVDGRVSTPTRGATRGSPRSGNRRAGAPEATTVGRTTAAAIQAAVTRRKEDIAEVVNAIPSSRHGGTEDMLPRSIGCQTLPVFFELKKGLVEGNDGGGGTQISSLLSEVRPWGGPAICLPRKGAKHLYVARQLPQMKRKEVK